MQILNNKIIKIAPSILSADFACLDREIKKVELGGADLLHVDVMDGHFVPNITIGPAVIKCIRRITQLPLDVHLMIERPDRLIDAFVAAGSDMITVHIEALSKAKIKAQSIKLRQKGIRFGLSLNPGTPLSRIRGVLDFADFILVMSVNPGFSGQKFIPAAIPKIKKLRAMFKGEIAVDGGVNDQVAGDLIRAGADILASGSYVFQAKDTLLAIDRIRRA